MVNVDRHTIFSVILLLAAFLAGFIVSAFVLTPEMSFPACSFDGGEITAVVNDEYYDAVSEQILNAEESVYVIMFSMKAYSSNNSVQQLEDMLILANDKGVDVKVLLDQSEWHGSITSTTKENWKTKDYFEAGGVGVKMDDLKETTHVKMIIIDGKIVIIGSTNWTYSALERNNEASVIIENSELAQYYTEYFESLWKNS